VDRRLRAALEGGAVLTLTIIVAVVVAHRESPGPTVPARVSLLAPVDAGTEHVHFLVRGGGCDSHTKEHIHGPSVQYRTHSIEVAFRIDRDGVTPCPGGDPGKEYVLNLVTPLSSRELRDSTGNPPHPFANEPRIDPGEQPGRN
jgi:hypothetical protein